MKKLDPKTRRAEIMRGALSACALIGYSRVTRDQIAAHAGCSPTLLTYHIGTMPNIRRAIMRAAVREECLSVIAQGLALRDPQAMKAPEELRKRALAACVGA